jgi:DUF4097 and DUF4098 domain-containing protein YvlB
MRTTLLLLFALLLPAVAPAQTDRTIAVREGSRLELHTQHGSITIRTWDRSSVHLEAQHDPSIRVGVEEAGSTLRVQATSPRGKKVDVEYTLTVPRSMDLSLHAVHGPISVDGAGGRLEANNVKGGIEIRGGNGFVGAHSVEGGITITGARGQISANSVNAGITVSDASGPIEATTVNGSVQLKGIDSRGVEATTVNGSVVYDGTIHRDGRYSLKSHNGPIVLSVPPGTGADVSVSTFNGSFSASFPITFTEARQGKSFRFALGPGGAHIELQSFNGPIRLRRPGER